MLGSSEKWPDAEEKLPVNCVGLEDGAVKFAVARVNPWVSVKFRKNSQSLVTIGR
jgi:hypothetical protein